MPMVAEILRKKAAVGLLSAPKLPPMGRAMGGPDFLRPQPNRTVAPPERRFTMPGRTSSPTARDAESTASPPPSGVKPPIRGGIPGLVANKAKGWVKENPVAAAAAGGTALGGGAAIAANQALKPGPGMLEQAGNKINEWGGQAVDWAKNNPGLAAGGAIGAAGLLYWLLKRNRDDE